MLHIGNRLFICFLICVVICFVSITLSSAQDPKKGMKPLDIAQTNGLIQGTRWALLVGIGDYPASTRSIEVSKLQSAVNDVRVLEAFLKDPQKGGFNAEHIFTLTDENAKQRNILNAIDDISRNATEKDIDRKSVV